MSIVAPPNVSLHEWETTWSLDDDAYELVDGVPTMTPPETGINIEAAALLHEKLAPLVRPMYRVLPNYGVQRRMRDGRDTVRQPDLVVLPRQVNVRGTYVPAGDVTLTVEVVSPSSIERDWVTKRAEYAAAGIPNYLIVDVRTPGDPRLWLFDQIAQDASAESGDGGGSADPSAAGGAATYPRYADPTGDGLSVTIRIPDADPITINAADLV